MPEIVAHLDDNESKTNTASKDKTERRADQKYFLRDVCYIHVPIFKKSCLYATFQPRKTIMLNEILQLPTQRLHVYSFSRKHVK